MTIYHYCSGQAFHSIIDNQTIWLSSLLQSNDSMEGKLTGHVLNGLAEREDIDLQIRLRMSEAVNSFREFVDGLGMCFSREPDLLSQWRGYADDGAGFAIGFNEDYLRALGSKCEKTFDLNEVIYNQSEQEARISHVFAGVKAKIAEGAYGPMRHQTLLGTCGPEEIEAHNAKVDRLSQEADLVLIRLFDKFFHFKSHAFAEENEVRILASNIRSLRKIDVSDETIHYRHARGRIVPYRPIKLAPIDGYTAIDKVMFGPKNPSNELVIRYFLASKGFNNVVVDRSEASYC